ncbi:MAG: arsenite methyltransferase [Phycisphaerales bacterium]|nr:MAG: arsenite methyltransferase [Phycisphaerales bacterium]
MSIQDTIRERVAKDYAKVVSASSSGPCCGGEVEQKGVAAKLGGYTADELKSLPADAVVNSFGCGNPVAFSGVKEGDVVVDLGSGAGIDILLAAKKVGPTGRVIGIDMTDEMIERANENIKAAGLTNVEVRKGLIEEMPVESGTVDWVISNCVINLSPEKDRVFAEIARVLKPGGKMAVSDIVVQNLPEWARNDPRLYSGCIAGAVSEEEYVEGLNKAGLREVEVIDRVVYNVDQIATFVESEMPADEAGSDCTCGCGSADEDLAQDIGEDMAGSVWSAFFMATKPAEAG